MPLPDGLQSDGNRNGIFFSANPRPVAERGLYRMLGKLEDRPLIDTLLKEIIGINLFKILFTRSHDERLDVGVSEIGNTAAFALGGLGVDKSLELLYSKAARQSLNPELAKRWAVTGRSFALYSIIFSMLWAMPFVRNYFTTQRIGSDRFTDVIKDRHNPLENAAREQKKQQEKEHLDQSLGHYKRRIGWITGLGLSGVLLASVVGLMGIRSTRAGAKAVGENLMARLFNAPAKPGAMSLQKLLLLEDGKFDHFCGFPALFFWGVPAYVGWIHASRDTYEKKEQVLKFANFTACFFGPPLLLNKFFEKKIRPYLVNSEDKISYANLKKITDPIRQEKALKLWASRTGLGLLSSILLLGTMPQLLNIYLTRKRLERAAAQQRLDIYKTSHSRHVLNGSAIPGITP